jgi:hypothetical protein
MLLMWDDADLKNKYPLLVRWRWPSDADAHWVKSSRELATCPLVPLVHNNGLSPKIHCLPAQDEGKHCWVSWWGWRCIEGGREEQVDLISYQQFICRRGARGLSLNSWDLLPIPLKWGSNIPFLWLWRRRKPSFHSFSSLLSPHISVSS